MAPHDLDSLRLLALSRIPRCAVCPRFHALLSARARGSLGALPAVPTGCTHQVCAPLVTRYAPAAAPRAGQPPRAQGCGQDAASGLC
jgi:hypothetical protein